MKNRLTPRQKKQRSYEKDGRNPYAEARGQAHHAIATRKAQASRALRRAETVSAAAALYDPERDVTVERTGARSWRKLPDAPLAKYVDARLARRTGTGMNGANKQSGLLGMAKKRARYRPFFCKGPLGSMER